MLFIMLFFSWNYAKKICFLPYIMLNYSTFCLIMLCTISTCPSAQQARTSACFAEIHIKAFKHCRGASASQDRSLKGKGKARELQAFKIFQCRKGEGERERGGGGGRKWGREEVWEKSWVTKGRNFVVAGHRPWPVYMYPPGARPPI